MVTQKYSVKVADIPVVCFVYLHVAVTDIRQVALPCYVMSIHVALKIYVIVCHVTS